MTQPVTPLIWGDTHRGRQREHNEDQVYPNSRHPTSIRPPSEAALQARGYLLAVADGIGGAQVGDTASNFAIRALVDHYYADPRQLPIDRLLESAVKTANTNVWNYVQTSPAFQQVGCTLTAAVIQGSQLVVAHVGDSRAYLIQDDRIYRLTTDHTVAQARAAGLQLPPGSSPLPANALTRSLGAGPDVEVDIGRYTLQPGDTVVLCSDGLHGVISEEEIRQVASRNAPQKGARKLIDRANQAGGPDNISVIIARLSDPATAASLAGRLAKRPVGALLVAGVLLVLAVLIAGLLTDRGRGPTANTPAPGTPVAVVIAPSPTTTNEILLAAPPTNTAVAAMPTETPTPAAVAVTESSAEVATSSSREPTSTPITPTATPTPRPTSTPVPTPTPVPPPPPTPTRPGESTPPPAASLLPAPQPMLPNDGDSPSDRVVFVWDYDGSLTPGQVFRLFLRTEQGGQPEREWTFDAGRNRNLTLIYDQLPNVFKIEGSEYFWKVAVVRASNGQRLGRFSAERRFVFTRQGEPSPPTDTPVPPTDTPVPPTDTPVPPAKPSPSPPAETPMPPA